jgi:hypothetical protein
MKGIRKKRSGAFVSIQLVSPTDYQQSATATLQPKKQERKRKGLDKKGKKKQT